MESISNDNLSHTHAEAHERFKATLFVVHTCHQAWEEAQGRFERAAISQGMNGELTRRARTVLVQAYERYALARAEHEIARHHLWESAKAVQLESDLSRV